MEFTWTSAGRFRTWTISTSSVHMPQGRRTGEARGIALLAHVVETTPFDSGHGKITLFLLLQTRPWGREYPAQPWSIIRQRVQRISPGTPSHAKSLPRPVRPPQISRRHLSTQRCLRSPVSPRPARVALLSSPAFQPMRLALRTMAFAFETALQTRS